MALRDKRLVVALAGTLNVLLGLMLSQTAYAEVRVTGPIESVTVEARDASVAEVFAALSAKFGLLVHNSAALNQPGSGTYQGSLQQVVARLLAGRDYMARHSGGKLEVTILGGSDASNLQPIARGPATSVAPPAPSPPAVSPAPASSPIVEKGRLMFAPR